MSVMGHALRRMLPLWVGVRCLEALAFCGTFVALAETMPSIRSGGIGYSALVAFGLVYFFAFDCWFILTSFLLAILLHKREKLFLILDFLLFFSFSAAVLTVAFGGQHFSVRTVMESPTILAWLNTLLAKLLVVVIGKRFLNPN